MSLGALDSLAVQAGVALARKKVGADYAIGPASLPGMASIPRLGPQLTMRAVNSEPVPADHLWQPGDLELF